jgi:nitroreductase
MIKAIKKIKASVAFRLDAMLFRFFARYKWTASIYYGLLSNQFAGEHYGVLQGRLRYITNDNAFKLRRNIHRLEKGLIMRPRKAIYGRDYILETVKAYENYVQCATTPDLGLEQWAHDVLTEYFLVTDDCTPITQAKEIFACVTSNSKKSQIKDEANAQGGAKEQFVPYHRNTQQPIVSYEEFFALTRRRRSVRWYLDRPVPRTIIDKAVQAAVQAPSACNRQPFTFKIFDDKALVQRILQIPMGTKGFAHNVPTVAVVTGHLDAYFHERDRHVIYIDASLAVMGFLYALETQQVSSCVVNWPDMEPQEKQIAALLGLPASERVIMLVVFGYADEQGMVPYSYKKDLDSVRSYNPL